jgi:hypothetical protein
MTTSERLERETERTREQIEATLDELRARMTPGQVVDQLVDYAYDSSGGMFFHNLRRQVVNNPLPVALMGAGLAWLAVASRNGRVGGPRTSGTFDRFGPRAQDAARRSADTAGEWAEQARGAAADATSGIGRQARHAGAAASDAAASAYDQAKNAASSSYSAAAETASAAYEAAADRTAAAAARVQHAAGAMADTASGVYDAAAEQMRRTGGRVSRSAAHMRENISGAGRSLMSLLNEQPLVLAGLGLAIGAAIGAALPATEIEDELMGEESDALKDQASAFAGEQLDKGKAVAEQAWESAKQEGEKAGLMPQSGDGGPDRDLKSAQPGSDAARFAQGATGGEDATLVPSSGQSEPPEPERKRDLAGT